MLHTPLLQSLGTTQLILVPISNLRDAIYAGDLESEAATLRCTDGAEEHNISCCQLLHQLPPQVTDAATSGADAAGNAQAGSLLDFVPQQDYIAQHSWDQALEQLQQHAAAGSSVKVSQELVSDLALVGSCDA